MGTLDQIAFAREPVTESLIEEMIPLLVQNNAETGTDGFDLEPSFDQYLAMDQAGYIRLFTARKDSKLIGYQVFVINPNLHYKYVSATSDVVYISPEHRGFGHKFMADNESKLKAESINAIFQNISAKKDASKLMEWMGYHLEDRVYMKRLS